jgi:cell fate (sporulation/competence/biofilm development) regulator YmcA (YheA/YmcA/DUF963 family)
MPPKKESKIRDIKETASDAVEIIRELRTPEVQETLDKVKTLTESAKGIMLELKSPEWVQNIDNFRMISENIDNTSARMEGIVKELKTMEIINEATGLVKTARTKLDSFGDGAGTEGVVTDFRETAVAVKEMLQSLKALMDELRVAISGPQSTGIIKDVRQSARDVSSTIQTIKNPS